MTPTTALLFPVVRGLIATTLLLLVGVILAEGIVARRVTGREAAVDAELRGWFSRLPGLLGWFLLMLSLGRAALQLLSFVDPGESVTPDLIRGMLWQGSWGNAWLMQTCAAFALLTTMWLFRNNDRLRRPVAVVLVAILLWSETGMGHAVDALWGPWLGRVVSLVHLVGGGYWLGTLGALALVVFPALRGDEHLPMLAAVVRDFSVPARIGAALLLLSGVRAAWTDAGSLAAIPVTTWGQLLIAKVLCLGGVAAIGWWNWKVVTPCLERGLPVAPSRLRRAVLIELSLGVLMLAITSLLIAAPLPVHAP
ncbi:MAG: CopD family protein [Gemmatimonadales bacterium]